MRRDREPMPCPAPAGGDAGLTLLELVVAVAIVSVLAGAMVPLIVAQVDRENHLKTVRELDALSDALEAYFEDHGTFPASLEARDFLGRYLEPGVDRDAIHDAWGGGGLYGYRRSRRQDRVVLLSTGPDGVAANGRGDDIVCRVHGAVAGNRRTRARLAIIAVALERFLAGGGNLTGDWRGADRRALGLGPEFDRDGFGTPLRSTAGRISIRSAGADRKFHTGDDLTL